MCLKNNLKFLMVLGIILLSVFVLNASALYAAEANANSLDNVPDVIETGIATKEALEDGYMTGKLNGELCEKIKEYITDDMTNATVIVSFGGEMLLDMAKADVRIYTNDTAFELIAKKTVTLKYTDSWNETDKEYVKNKAKDLDLSLKSLEIDFGDTRYVDDIVSEGFEKEINDSKIKCRFYAGMGQEFYPVFCTQGILAIGTEDVIYYTVSTDVIDGTAVMTIPQTVEDTEKAYIDYALSKLKTLEHFADVELKMEKETEEGQYAVYAESPDPMMIVLRKEKIEEVKEIVDTDKTTNVKLETKNDVVPENTVLEVKAIEKGTVYDTVKKVVSNVKDFIVYDITLKSEGVKIQPNGDVKISIPVPSDMGTNNLVVYRVSDDGKKTEYKVTVEKEENANFATFLTDHFSTYVLAEKEVKTVKDNTPDTGAPDYTNIMLAYTVISILGITLLKKKEVK